MNFSVQKFQELNKMRDLMKKNSIKFKDEKENDCENLHYDQCDDSKAGSANLNVF